MKNFWESRTLFIKRVLAAGGKVGPPAALPGAKLLKKFDQNFSLPFGR
jgi:hypothetical protein